MVKINNHTGIVIANGSECKIFSINVKEKRLHLKNNISSSAVRLHNINLGEVRPGRNHESSLFARHGIEPRTEPQHKEKLKFVHDICEFLHQKSNMDEYTNLILIASPEILGELRKNLDKNILSMVIEEMNKDLVHVEEKEVLKHVLG